MAVGDGTKRAFSNIIYGFKPEGVSGVCVKSQEGRKCPAPVNQLWVL